MQGRIYTTLLHEIDTYRVLLRWEFYKKYWRISPQTTDWWTVTALTSAYFNRCQIYCAFLPNDPELEDEESEKSVNNGRDVRPTTTCFVRGNIWIFSDTVIYVSSGIAGMFVAYDLLTSLDIYLWGCIRKRHRHETKSRNIVVDAVIMWNGHESVWQVTRVVVGLFHWCTASAGCHLE
jgi:hypothetical protein